jgi:hypothetical protein
MRFLGLISNLKNIKIKRRKKVKEQRVKRMMMRRVARRRKKKNNKLYPQLCQKQCLLK